jgi:ceramide glucosyltransferase
VNAAGLPALVGAAYYALAIAAALRFRRAAPPSSAVPLPVSILKPVHGRDPRFYEALVSHARQEYPEFEILFGVSDPQDPALQDIERLRREFPSLPVSVHVVPTSAPNMKVGVLAGLAACARYPWLVVNDSDILVGPGYLREVTAPLANPEVGLVTCLYRASADHWPVRAEALGIATEFAPSVMVARLLGQAEFALGSTMAFRAETLASIGGFAPISVFLADDYQLGRCITESGRKVVFSRQVVETSLAGRSLADVWRHQVRWSRTVRVSRPSGYYGYAVTHVTVWALVAAAAGAWQIAAAAVALRLAAGVLVGASILKYRRALSDFWLMPLRDLFGFAVWLAGIFGRHVEWRGQRLRLQTDGTIRPPA